MKVALVTPRDTHSPVILPLACVNEHDEIQSDPSTISSLNYSQIPIPESSSNHLPGWHEVRELLDGRALLPDELPFSYKKLEPFIRRGYVHMQAGIHIRPRLKCTRCGNNHKHWFSRYACAWCDDACLYCRACISMGRVTTCTPLFTWKGPALSGEKTCVNILAWGGELSSLQQRAADRISQTIKQSRSAELLVWAVCGAGKTEMLFPGISCGLEKGKRVLIATPRTDVVLELLPRLRQAFPTAALTGLYGGSEERLSFGQLVVATTHQTRRFQDAFDVAIIDEVDAFPYRFDESLAYAVKKATRKNAATIYLTATPDDRLRKRCENKDAVIRVNRRFHGFPLPIPGFQWCGDWRKTLLRERLPKTFSNWADQQLASGRQALIFVPSVQTAKAICKVLQQREPSIGSVHAEDPERKEIVENFRNGDMPLLITTTILERGVTIYGIDVAVLGSEDEVFTASALVQIAGRAGRSAEDPDGKVTFFHYGKTKAMHRCRKQILAMNGKDGRENGS
ncbi:DEAD/DEAH box helicase [Salicibibacter cibi]|uniref:DEAD/DEAH box helicase n=1 Tax=Salicibibacter cibi TaxID=2743001 RepID=A0A7T6ZDL2_9BACI|nr:DEAD/DEAH box helicase [Salicibibacter cibi]QQK81585.1 DEAD/DEAH box helicase [Salicibibacter cibi]